MPRSQTPADPPHPACSVRTMLPSVIATTSAPPQTPFRGSITRPAGSLCTLRRRGRPRTTQHSVPAGGQPLPDQDFHLAGSLRRFPSCYRIRLPPSPGFAWRNANWSLTGVRAYRRSHHLLHRSTGHSRSGDRSHRIEIASRGWVQIPPRSFGGRDRIECGRHQRAGVR